MTEPSTSRSAPGSLTDLPQTRLVMVTGKGGTGKTTFAAALALLGAVRGRRTLLVEVDSQRPSLTPIVGFEPHDRPKPCRDRLEVANLTWQPALAEFLEGLVPSSRIVKLVLANPVVGRFLDFTPGSQELVELSAIANASERYDLVVVDMPASGHAYSLLDVTRSAMGLFRSGPVRKRAEELRALLQRPTTRLAFVALPEEMVVNETIETLDKMRRAELLSTDPWLFLNKATLPSLSSAERELLARLDRAARGPLEREFVQAGRWEDELEQATAEASERLRRATGLEPVLVGPAPPGGPPRAVVENVAVPLGRLLGLTRRELVWS